MPGKVTVVTSSSVSSLGQNFAFFLCVDVSVQDLRKFVTSHFRVPSTLFDEAYGLGFSTDPESHGPNSFAAMTGEGSHERVPPHIRQSKDASGVNGSVTTLQAAAPAHRICAKADREVALEYAKISSGREPKGS